MHRSCQGTGSDGNRVQPLYVVEQGRPDRYASVLPVLRNELATVDDTFALSAAETGGALRVWWVFDPATCEPDVTRVANPGPTNPGPTTPGPTTPGPTTPGPTDPGPTAPVPTIPGPATPGPGRPTVTVAGPATLRPWLPARLTAAPSGAGTVTVTWSVAPAACAIGSTTAATLVIQCPSGRSGRTTPTATFTRLDGLAATATATATATIALTGPRATLTSSLAVATGSPRPGQPTTLTAVVRYGTIPVRASVSIWSSTDAKRWSRVGAVSDTSATGRLSVQVRPARPTSYRLRVVAPPGTGWAVAAAPAVRVTATRWPVRLTAGWAPGQVSGRLRDAATGRQIAAAPVRLQQRVPGASTWRTLHIVRTSRSGGVQALVRTAPRTPYRWMFVGSSTRAPRTSGTVSIGP